MLPEQSLIQYTFLFCIHICVYTHIHHSPGSERLFLKYTELVWPGWHWNSDISESRVLTLSLPNVGFCISFPFLWLD